VGRDEGAGVGDVRAIHAPFANGAVLAAGPTVPAMTDPGKWPLALA
jgi:hypothetical protein